MVPKKVLPRRVTIGESIVWAQRRQIEILTVLPMGARVFRPLVRRENNPRRRQAFHNVINRPSDFNRHPDS